MTEHEPTERALRAALGAAADSVRAGDLAPSELPSPPPAQVAPPRLLRTRRGVVAIATTAVVAGGLGAGAVAAARPAADTPRTAPPAATPSATPSGAERGRPRPRIPQVDVDGDGRPDLLRARDGVLRVALTASDRVDRQRIPSGWRLLAVVRSTRGAVVLVGPGRREPQRLEARALTSAGFTGGTDPGEQLLTVRLDRMSGAVLRIKLR